MSLPHPRFDADSTVRRVLTSQLTHAMVAVLVFEPGLLQPHTPPHTLQRRKISVNLLASSLNSLLFCCLALNQQLKFLQQKVIELLMVILLVLANVHPEPN